MRSDNRDFQDDSKKALNITMHQRYFYRGGLSVAASGALPWALRHGSNLLYMLFQKILSVFRKMYTHLLVLSVHISMPPLQQHGSSDTSARVISESSHSHDKILQTVSRTAAVPWMLRRANCAKKHIAAGSLCTSCWNYFAFKHL